jgi:hypothetical protein
VPLRVSPCRSLCDWRRTRGAAELFACAGCGSQWARTEAWTPRQADGSWPPGVREELARPELTSGPSAGGAGSAGS